VRRKGGLTALSTQRQAGCRLKAKLRLQDRQLRSGVLQLRAVQEGEASAHAHAAELEERTQRADVLLHKMESRRSVLQLHACRDCCLF